MSRPAEDCLLGLKKTGKRVIVVPAEAGNHPVFGVTVPGNVIVVVEIELLKLKKNERSGSQSRPRSMEVPQPQVDSALENTLNLPSLDDTPTPTTVPVTEAVSVFFFSLFLKTFSLFCEIF